MATLQRQTSADTARVTVTRAMNDHDAMTVVVVENDAVRQVVDYESRAIRETLERLPRGTTIRMQMTPIEARGNLWRVTDI
jgi:hypothetical protein